MKNKICRFTLLLAIAISGVFIGYKTNFTTQNGALQFAMDNVEALAQGEGSSGNRSVCYYQCIPSGNTMYLDCHTCCMVLGIGRVKGNKCPW